MLLSLRILRKVISSISCSISSCSLCCVDIQICWHKIVVWRVAKDWFSQRGSILPGDIKYRFSFMSAQEPKSSRLVLWLPKMDNSSCNSYWITDTISERYQFRFTKKKTKNKVVVTYDSYWSIESEGRNHLLISGTLKASFKRFINLETSK